MQFSLISAASFLLLAPLASAVTKTSTNPVQPPKQVAKLGTATSQGCFKSAKGLEASGLQEIKLSVGACGAACQALDKAVFALGSADCYCGDAYPPEADLTDDSACDSACPAYALEACGSVDGDAFSVYNTGGKLNVPYYGGDDKSSSSVTATGTKTAATGTVSKMEVSTSLITKVLSSETALATTDSTDTTTDATTDAATTETSSTETSSTDAPTTTTSAAVATSSIPSSGSKSMMGAGVAILFAALAI